MRNVFIVFLALFSINSYCLGQIVNEKPLEQYCNQNEKRILKEFNKYAVSDSTLPYQMFLNNSNELFVFQHDEKSDKCNGKLILNGNTYQVYGSYGASDTEGTFFGVLTENNQVKGIIRWYYYIEDDSQNNYDGVSVNRVENGKEFSSNLPVISSATCYDEYEIDMIGTAEKYRVNENDFAVKYYQAEDINFSYKESDNYVQGILTVKGNKCDVYGIYMGEGMYFGSVWFNGNSKGILYWDYSDSCIVLTNKINCKTFDSEVCKTEKPTNNNPFGSEGNGTNGGFGEGTGKQYGNDNGAGNGPSGPDRKRITKVDLSKVEVSESASLIFKVNIDKEGNVVSAYYLPSGMTTVDNSVIEEIRKVLVEQLKYEKSNTFSSDRITIELRKR